MSTLGQKIKETFTGHHDQDKRDVKTPDVNAPGAFPSDDSATKHHSDHNKLTKEPPEHVIRQDKEEDVDKGAQHHTGHAHHDPEPETKQATSDAGNYPYWGDLPREGGQHVYRSSGPDSDPTKQYHGLSNESTLATGASTAGGSSIGAGYLDSHESRDDDMSKGDDTTRADSTEDPKFDRASKGAGVAGLAGATYLATRHEDDADKTENKQTPKDSNAPAHAKKSAAVEEKKRSTTTQKPVEAATPTKTTSTGDNNSHRKEEEVLAAGAGAAGLAGAGYYASQKGDKRDEEKREASSHATQGSHTQTLGHTGTARHDPTTEAQKATSAAGNYPYWKDDDNGDKSTKDTTPAEAATPSKTTSSGDNNTHRKEKEALTAGAGALGLAGAGYQASRDREGHREDKQSSLAPGQATSQAEEHHTYTSGYHDRETDAKRTTGGAGDYSQRNGQETEDSDNKKLAAAGLGGAALAGTGYLASKKTDERRGELPGSTRETSSGIAAPDSLAVRDSTSRQVEPASGGGIHNTVVGAGSTEYSHPAGSSNTTSAGHQTTTPSQAGQPAAQAAALQAWNKQQPESSGPDGDKGGDSKHSDLKYAAAGTAFGAGAAGIAADYGQGKDHEESPRTAQAEKVAERALGSDGKPHAPSATQGPGSTVGKGASSGAASGHGVAGFSGQSESTGKGARVFHKCDECGHDNDISRYFDKDAVFHSQQ